MMAVLYFRLLFPHSTSLQSQYRLNFGGEMTLSSWAPLLTIVAVILTWAGIWLEDRRTEQVWANVD